MQVSSPRRVTRETERKLRFSRPLIVVGGALENQGDLLDLYRPGYGLVGADSGGDAIVAAGLVPDAVIGDFDSLSGTSVFGPATEMIAVAEQDGTDFEKVLERTEAPLTLALGMTGRRFDHTLAALHALARFSPRPVALVDDVDAAIAISGDLSALELGAGTRVSIYPLGRTAFAGSSGLAYSLEGKVLEQGRRIGTSNRATASAVEVRVAAGAQDPWLLIVPRTRLGALIARWGGNEAEPGPFLL